MQHTGQIQQDISVKTIITGRDISKDVMFVTTDLIPYAMLHTECIIQLLKMFCCLRYLQMPCRHAHPGHISCGQSFPPATLLQTSSQHQGQQCLFL